MCFRNALSREEAIGVLGCVAVCSLQRRAWDLQLAGLQR